MLELWTSWLLFISRWQTFSSNLSRFLNLSFWIWSEGLHLNRILQSVLHLTTTIIHKTHVYYSSSLSMSLRPSENTQIRLCKKCSAAQCFLLNHGSNKYLVVTFAIAYNLIIQMQETQVFFPSSCCDSSPPLCLKRAPRLFRGEQKPSP